jgi:hypothetical protein
MARPQYDELPSGPRDCDVIQFAFDLLESDGADLRPLPLIDRGHPHGRGLIELDEFTTGYYSLFGEPPCQTLRRHSPPYN